MQIDVRLVEGLVREQFPAWAGLEVAPVAFGGWDNRTFRLGREMSVRLPSAAGYVAQVEKEQHWLPRLAPLLPLPIPVPLAMGQPGLGYPWAWSVYRWLEGESAAVQRIANVQQTAAQLGAFLLALQRVDATAGPLAGTHNFWRGGPLTVYDEETRRALAALQDKIATDAALAVWETALAARWDGPPVWVHGDVAVGNLLLHEGELAAVIDFGCMGVGDPACDTVIAWTLFADESREAFWATLALDAATRARGRGWALWKALIMLVEHQDTNPVAAAQHQRVIDAVLADARAV